MIRRIWLQRRLDWHHWRASRLAEAAARHSRKYRTLQPAQTAAYTNWVQQIAREHLVREVWATAAADVATYKQTHRADG